MLQGSHSIKPNQINSVFDKENNSISSNILFERKQLFSQKYKKTNELIVKHQIPIQTDSLINFSNPLHIHKASYTQTRFLEELDAAKKVNSSKIKKTLSFELRKSAPIEESNYHQTLINNYCSMGAEREKVPIPIAEREKRHISDSFITKQDKEIKIVAIESPKKFTVTIKSYDFKAQQTKLIEPYLSCIIDSLKEKDVGLKF